MAEKSAALKDAAEHFASVGLPFPFIPLALQPGFRRVGEWLYGTRPDVDNLYDMLYDMGWFAKEIASKPVDDYVLVGRGGRGMQSNAICYYLAAAPLAVFIQSSWGGVYSDEQAAVARIERRFALAQLLYQAAQNARSAGRIQPDERLIVLDSDFSGGSWIRITGLMDEEDFTRSSHWRTEKDVLAKTLTHLKG